MSLKTFHGVSIALCIILCTIVAIWAAGYNASAQKTPWALAAAALGAVLMIPYLSWYRRKARHMR